MKLAISLVGHLMIIKKVPRIFLTDYKASNLSLYDEVFDTTEFIKQPRGSSLDFAKLE